MLTLFIFLGLALGAGFGEWLYGFKERFREFLWWSSRYVEL